MINRQVHDNKTLPIGAAISGLKGGILRAEQVLTADNMTWIRRERQFLYERIEECKYSLAEENYPSIPSKLLSKNAPEIIDAAESILQKLSQRLSLAIRLSVSCSKS